VSLAGAGISCGRRQFHVGRPAVRADAKQHASRANSHLRKRTSHDQPTAWLAPPTSAKRRHRYTGTDAPHGARRFHRGHRRSRRPVAHSRRLSAESRSLGQARTRTCFRRRRLQRCGGFPQPLIPPSRRVRTAVPGCPIRNPSRSLFPGGKLLSATPWPTPLASRSD
jgi:hypothetical protein